MTVTPTIAPIETNAPEVAPAPEVGPPVAAPEANTDAKPDVEKK